MTSFRLEKNVGGYSEHQNSTSDTNTYKGYFFTARVTQVHVNTMKRSFEQRSELQVPKCLIVHVLSNSYNVSSPELRNHAVMVPLCRQLYCTQSGPCIS